MALSIRSQPGRGLCLVVASGVLLTALTAATAAAAVPPAPTPAPELSRLGTAASATPSSRTDASARPRTPIPGFLLARGRYVAFDASQAQFSTLPYDINDRGQIVGRYNDGSEQPFLRDPCGRFTTLPIPGARSAWASSINNRGQISGYTSDAAGTMVRGFLLARGVRGPFTPIQFPGAPHSLVTGLNDRGQLVGAYENPDATPSPQPTQPPMGRMA